MVLGVPIKACAEPALNDYIDSVFKSIQPELSMVFYTLIVIGTDKGNNCVDN